MKFLHAIIGIVFLTACNSNPNSEEAVPQINKAPHQVTVEELVHKQILLTNDADFTNVRRLKGASAFLVHYKDSIYAVTAKHLIGPDGGVEPAVELNHLSKKLLQWKMYPRVPIHPATDTVIASAGNLNYVESTSDALLLKTVNLQTHILPLEPNFGIPNAGDTLYIIDCPYDEDNCKQNIYKVVFKGIAEGLFISEIFSDVEMAGFSGAPVVNKRGEVVGIIYGSGDFEGKTLTYATPISQIKKIQ